VTANTLSVGIAAVASKYNSATAIRSSKEYLWRHGKPSMEVVPSQFLKPTTRETTGFYVTRRSYAWQARRRVDPESCFGVEVSQIEAIDIDYEDDFKLAQIVWSGLNATRAALDCTG